MARTLLSPLRMDGHRCTWQGILAALWQWPYSLKESWRAGHRHLAPSPSWRWRLAGVRLRWCGRPLAGRPPSCSSCCAPRRTQSTGTSGARVPSFSPPSEAMWAQPPCSWREVLRSTPRRPTAPRPCTRRSTAATPRSWSCCCRIRPTTLPGRRGAARRCTPPPSAVAWKRLRPCWPAVRRWTRRRRRAARRSLVRRLAGTSPWHSGCWRRVPTRRASTR
mmetsp:Transcript_95098/g.293199  ORF Transcript_95098/g.293199 Transcript_95098/m.293199 type:complete len:220 (+) Transcript_95098:425-1084(+)